MMKTLADLSWPRKVNLILLMAAITALPLWLFIVPRILTFFVVSSIVVSIYERQKFQFKSEYLFLFLFYALYAVSFYWSDNQDLALKDMERKLSLLIFPLLFSFMTFSKAELKLLFYCFLTGLLAAILFSLYKANLLYQESALLSSFFYDSVAKPYHPGYLSMYMNFGCVILISDFFTKQFSFFKQNWVYFLIYILLFTFNVLLVSKIGLIVSFVILIIFVILFLKKKKAFLAPIIALAIGVLAFSAVYSYSDYARNTINELFQNTSYSAENSEQKAQGSTSLRWVIWESSMTLIAEEPLVGYGSGDTQQELVKQYEKDEQPFALSLNLNAHNQFFQTTLAVGVLGLGILVLMIVRMVVYGFKNKSYMLLGFCLIVCSNFFIESVLKVQAGTMFFGVFYCLLMVKIDADEA